MRGSSRTPHASIVPQEGTSEGAVGDPHCTRAIAAGEATIAFDDEVARKGLDQPLSLDEHFAWKGISPKLHLESCPDLRELADGTERIAQALPACELRAESLARGYIQLRIARGAAGIIWTVSEITCREGLELLQSTALHADIGKIPDQAQRRFHGEQPVLRRVDVSPREAASYAIWLVCSPRSGY